MTQAKITPTQNNKRKEPSAVISNASQETREVHRAKETPKRKQPIENKEREAHNNDDELTGKRAIHTFFGQFESQKEYRFVVPSENTNKMRIVSLKCDLVDLKASI